MGNIADFLSNFQGSIIWIGAGFLLLSFILAILPLGKAIRDFYKKDFYD